MRVLPYLVALFAIFAMAECQGFFGLFGRGRGRGRPRGRPAAPVRGFSGGNGGGNGGCRNSGSNYNWGGKSYLLSWRNGKPVQHLPAFEFSAKNVSCFSCQVAPASATEPAMPTAAGTE